MISDTLFDAITDIDRYLADPVFPYKDDKELCARIVALRDQMDAMRRELDKSPGPESE